MATPQQGEAVMGRRHASRLLAMVSAICLLGFCFVQVSTRAGAVPSASTAVTRSQTVTRTNVVDGQSQTVESDKVTITLSNTANLQGGQTIGVSWSGAHPTGGIVLDSNSEPAAYQEYPMVLMQCRGVDDDNAPADERMSPETCWTQSPSERYLGSRSSAFPAWRLDQYASAQERALHPGVPDPLPSTCTPGPAASDVASRWLPFLAADGTTFLGGPSTCAGAAPDAGASPVVPANTTYARTNVDGTGSARFVVSDDKSNASLGCSATVRCTFVAIPIMGISCDPAGASLPADDQPANDPDTDLAQVTQACESKGTFQPGESTGTQDDIINNPVITDQGRLWWSESNWRNRISVPLELSAIGTACGLQSSKQAVLFYGSPLAQVATTQWQPAFCADPSKTPFRQVSFAEPASLTLLDDGSADAVLASDPRDDYTAPTVNAPVLASGFAISYTIDDAQGNAYHQLRLDARLVAKLLTQSYPAAKWVAAAYPQLRFNPLSMLTDPEFIALNPDLRMPVAGSDPGAELFSISGNSDTISALTSYINADPEARAFLDGQADPWGMRVNPNYLNISLPVAAWQLRDTFVPFGPINGTNCVAQAPWLSSVASPSSSFDIITRSLLYALPNSQTTCQDAIAPDGATVVSSQLVTAARQTPGNRFIIGVTTLAEADFVGLDVAALQSNGVQPSLAPFTSDAGRYFASPSPESMAAALTFAKAMTPTPPTGKYASQYWPIDYAAMSRSALGSCPAISSSASSAPSRSTSKPPTPSTSVSLTAPPPVTPSSCVTPTASAESPSETPTPQPSSQSGSSTDPAGPSQTPSAPAPHSSSTRPSASTSSAPPPTIPPYPGTMLIYAVVPITGIDPQTAVAIADVLRFAATSGQTLGQTAGTLPPGYLPLTSANGLAALAAYTLSVADDVEAQRPLASPSVSSAATAPSPRGSQPSSAAGQPKSAAPRTSGAASSAGATQSAPPAPTTSAPLVLAQGTTGDQNVGFAAVALPALLALAVVSGLGSAVTALNPRRRRRT